MRRSNELSNTLNDKVNRLEAAEVATDAERRRQIDVLEGRVKDLSSDAKRRAFSPPTLGPSLAEAENKRIEDKSRSVLDQHGEAANKQLSAVDDEVKTSRAANQELEYACQASEYHT